MSNEIKQILVHTAYSLTLLGLVETEEDFSTTWLGRYSTYMARDSEAFLASDEVFTTLRFGMGLAEVAMQADVEDAMTPAAFWKAKVRHQALRAAVRKLERWVERNGVTFAM